MSDESLRRLSILHELLATLSGSMDVDGELDRRSETLARALVLDAVAQAGEEVVSQGQVNQETMAALTQDLAPPEVPPAGDGSA